MELPRAVTDLCNAARRTKEIVEKEVSERRRMKEELQKDEGISKAIELVEGRARAVLQEKGNETRLMEVVAATIKVLRSGDFLYKAIHPERYSNERIASMVYEQVVRVRNSLSRTLAEQTVWRGSLTEQ